MRSFDDAAGVAWDVAVGKESFGTMVLLFARRGGVELRRAPVPADTRLEAEGLLAGLDDAGLRARLGEARAFDPAAGRE